MQVFKFGGASVKDADSVRNIANILGFWKDKKTIVVVSAMGKITNELEALVNAYFFGKKETGAILEEIKTFHDNIARQLFPDTVNPVSDALANLYVELSWSIEEPPSGSYDFHYDQIVSQGEMLSTRIVAAYLQQAGLMNTWVDARDLIRTDNTYREGRIDFETSGQLVNAHLLPAMSGAGLVITQGFIGGTSENFTTTLGREGSDYTAALLAYFVQAEHVTIWKDVPGVLSADPKVFSDTTKIAELSYHDAIELTYYGASVIHPKTIKPLQNRNIPLYVKSFLDPAEKGTVIRETEHRTPVTSYIIKERQILISIMPKDFSFIAEDSLSEIFRVFSEHHVRINMMQNSALSFSVCADDEVQKTLPLMEALKTEFRVLYNDHVTLLTIRNYEQENLNRLVAGKEVLIEQRSRNTVQVVVKSEKIEF